MRRLAFCMVCVAAQFVWFVPDARGFSIQTKGEKVTISHDSDQEPVLLFVYRVRRPLALLRALVRKDKFKSLHATRWQMQLNALRQRRTLRKHKGLLYTDTPRGAQARARLHKRLRNQTRTRMFALAGLHLFVPPKAKKKLSSLSLRPYGPGFYVFEAETLHSYKSATTELAYLPTFVHHIDVHTRRDRHGLHLYAHDTRHNRPLSGARVSILRGKKVLHKGRTNTTGLAFVRLRTHQALRVVLHKGKHTRTFRVTRFSGLGHPDLRLFAYTNRDAFLPGERVHYKVIARWRRPEGGLMMPSPLRPLKLKVKMTVKGAKLSPESTCTLNAFGSCAGTLRLPRITGRHKPHLASIKFWSPSPHAVQWHYIRILPTRRPTPIVRLRSDKSIARGGQPFSFFLHATEPGGQPLSQKSLRWRLVRFGYKQAQQSAGTQAQRALYFKKIQVHQRGVCTLDKHGKKTLRFVPPPEKQDALYQLQVWAKGKPSPQTIAQIHGVLVVTQPHTLSLTRGRMLYYAHETARLTATLRHKDRRPLRGQRLTLRCGTWQKHATTDAQGKAHFEMRQPTPVGNIHCKASYQHPTAPLLQAKTSFWRIPKQGLAQHSKKHTLQQETRSYRPGEAMRWLLSSPHKGTHWWVTIESHGVQTSRIVRAPNHLFLLEEKARERYAPGGTLTLTAIHCRSPKQPNQHCHSSTQTGTFEVQMPQRSLRISLATPHPKRPQRGMQRLRILVTDAQGRPQPNAELSISLVHKALRPPTPLYISSPNSLAKRFFPQTPAQTESFQPPVSEYSEDSKRHYRFQHMMQTAPSVFTRPFQGLLARYRASLHKGQTQRALRIYEALRTYVQAHRYWKKQPLGRGGWGYGGIGRSFTITSRCGGFRTGSRLGFGIGVPHGRLLIFENIPRPLVLEWIPSLRTNHKGIASFQTRFPPTKAQWELSIVAHTPQTRTGQRSFLLTSTP